MTTPTFSFDGKHVLVVGGASGIGFAVAERAKELGARVTIASRSGAQLDQASGLTGFSAKSVNISDEADVQRFFGELGSVDHIAVTAGDWGGSMFAPTVALDLKQARDSLNVRFWGSLAVAKHGSSNIAPGGSIVLTGGMLSQRPMKGAPLATALAGAMEHLARGLAIDLPSIRVNVVSPGLILTEQVRQMMPDEVLQASTQHLPIPRPASPREAALAYIYLMQNSYITGQVLPVDGGGWLV